MSLSAAGDRAKQRDGAQARLPQLRLVRAQLRNYPLGRLHDNSKVTLEFVIAEISRVFLVQ